MNTREETVIDSALVFIKNRMNAHFNIEAISQGSAKEGPVAFVDSKTTDSITFKPDAVTALLVNAEQERALRAPDPFARSGADGAMQRVHPEIRLNLFVLFAVRYADYATGLGYLSKVIRYFQVNPTFDHRSAPDLDDNIERLVIELVTLPLAQLNDLWSALRTAYVPSVLYKVGLIVYRDEAADSVTQVKELQINTAP
jgi:Pvc16 N-terminal domain